jgi:hypothetical protein
MAGSLDSTIVEAAPVPKTLRNSRRLTPLPQLQLQPQDSSLGVFVFDFIEDLLLSQTFSMTIIPNKRGGLRYYCSSNHQS